MQDDIIYTENVLQIDQILTGNSKSNEVIILTRGGTIDGVTQFQSHGFSLRKGDKGYFFLKEKQSNWRENYYEVYAGRQGFYQKRHDGFMTMLYSQMKSYPSLNSFYKDFGFEYDELKFEEEMRALNNPDACLRYRLEPIESTNIGTSNQISFNIFVRSTEPVSLRELSIQLNYSTNWFGQNVVANNKLNLNDGDFNESYTLQSSDVSEDILEVSLRSNSPIGQLQLVSGSEIKLATVFINFDTNASDLPIKIENTRYRSLFHDADGNLVRNNCGHIEISDRGCGPIITGIDIRKAAGDQSILTISGAGFIHSSVDPSGSDEWCGLPNMEHRVKFKSVSSVPPPGSPLTTISPLEEDYISWTNTEIQVKVPTQGYLNDSFERTDERKDEIAGTGEITVCIDDTDMDKCVCFETSGFNDNPNDGILYVPFSTYTRDNTSETNYQLGDCLLSDHARLISRITSQEVLFNLENLPLPARESFERALDTWRCAIDINLRAVNGTSSFAVQVNFSTNVTQGLLAETFQNIGNCLADNQKVFFPSTIDFLANNNVFWDFSLDPSNINQDAFDFESAALHKIGHAIGLNHTCNDINVMRPKLLSRGETFRELSNDEIEGGSYCKARGEQALPTNNSCGLPLIPAGKFSTSTSSPFKNKLFNAYPNPTENEINIELINQNDPNALLRIYNTNGELMKEKKVTSFISTVHLSDLSSGIYFINLQSQGESIVEKIIKQ